MEFLYSFAFNLLLNLLFDSPAVPYKEPPSVKPVQALKVKTPQRMDMPEWVTHIPEDSFVGISRPCKSIEQARQQAIESALCQILQAMGAEYELTHESILSGNLHDSRHALKERLAYTAKWFVRSVHQNIKKSDIRQIQGKYICFVLIDFPPAMIERLRKLTIGPKVAARIIEKKASQFVIEARENNNVEVFLTDYHLKMTTKNRHANIITLFAWKVPDSAIQEFGGVFDRKIILKEKAETINIPHPPLDASLRSLILGSETRMDIVLQGHDEIGRPLSLRVNSFQKPKSF